MDDNEEGFAEEAAFELVDFNYKPSCRSWINGGKSYCSTIKKQNQLVLIGESRLINSLIQE